MFQTNADFDFGTVSTPVTTSDQDVQENISEAPSVEENSVDTSAFDFSLDLPSAYPEQEVSTPTTVALAPEVPSATMQMESLLADEPVAPVQASSSQSVPVDLNVSAPASAESESPVATGPFAQDHYVGGVDPFEAMKASLQPEEPVQQESVSSDVQTASLLQEEKTDIDQISPSVSEDLLSQAPETQEESLADVQNPASSPLEAPSQVDTRSFLTEDAINAQIKSDMSQSSVLNEASNDLSSMESSTSIEDVNSAHSSITMQAESVESTLDTVSSATREASVEPASSMQTVSLDDMLAQASQVTLDQPQMPSSVAPQLEIPATSVAPLSESTSSVVANPEVASPMLSLDEMIAQPSVATTPTPVMASSSQQVQDSAFAAVNPLTAPIGYPQIQQTSTSKTPVGAIAGVL